MSQISRRTNIDDAEECGMTNCNITFVSHYSYLHWSSLHDNGVKERVGSISMIKTLLLHV
jgi:hypothetical protein